MSRTVDTLTRLRQRLGVWRGTRGAIRLAGVSRKHLPWLFAELGLTRGAEIGVWKGAYSAALLAANPALHLLCIDPWRSYPAWLDTKNAMPIEEATAFIESAYRTASEVLAGKSCTIIRDFSVAAAAFVGDGSLDFVYIDANHVYDAVTEDLTIWSRKVRSGGLIAGHDYREFTNKPTIHVVRAVDDFTAAHGIDPWFILAKDPTPSFLWVNP